MSKENTRQISQLKFGDKELISSFTKTVKVQANNGNTEKIGLIKGTIDDTGKDTVISLEFYLDEIELASISITSNSNFVAMQHLRIHLEHQGILLLCYGASLDCHEQGGMLYRLKLGEGQLRERFNLWSEGPDLIPATVEQQNSYFQKWLASIN
jgi:hypothetical protein